MKTFSACAVLTGFLTAAVLCSCDENTNNAPPSGQVAKTGENASGHTNLDSAVRELNSAVRELREEIGSLRDRVAQATPKPQWEYRVLRFNAPPADARMPRRIDLSIFNGELLKQSAGGWELVFMQSENETVYPNFGNPEMTTGLHPNQRTASVICVFRKEKTAEK